MKASTLLLRTTIPQTTGVLMCKDGQMCASGVLLDYMGFNPKDLIGAGDEPKNVRWNARGKNTLSQDEFYGALMYEFGINQETWCMIQRHNDAGWGFDEIGDWLKGKGL